MIEILVIEDSPDYQLILKKALAGFGFKVSLAARCEEVAPLIAQNQYELILMDIVLPDGDGYSLCSQLQKDDKTKKIPVIFLTSRDDVTSKITAFSLGADDYLVKPFHTAELKARIESKIKRTRTLQEIDGTLYKGVFQFDFGCQKLTVAGDLGSKEVKLTPIEFKIIACLARNEGRVLSRDKILEFVWGQSSQVVDRKVDTHISALRKKLAMFSDCIESVSGLGYRFTSLTSFEKVVA